MASPRIVPTGVLGGIAGKDGSNVLPTDTAIKQAIENPASQTAVALSASYVPKWQTGTVYTVGQVIQAPDGGAVKVITAHTAGGAYDATKFTIADGPAASKVAGVTVNPSPVDARPLAVPARRAKPGDLPAGTRRNLWQYTENLADSSYNAGNTATKGTDLIVIDGITLIRFSSNNFYAELLSPVNGLGLTPFVVGHRYLLSYYVVSKSDAEHWFWMRTLDSGGSNGHGPKLVQPNVLTRVWAMAEATTTSHLAKFTDPTAGYASGGNDNPHWFFQGNGDPADMFIGGFQIDDVGTTARAGIVGIGDSTMQGAAGSTDLQSAREWMTYLAGLLNAYTFNRGVGGDTLAQMDTRWATSVTPLAGVCNYVIIQGGINDLSQGRTLTQMQASTTSMAAKASADGLTAVYLTLTPFSLTASTPALETQRLAYNAWLRQSFVNVIDIASVVADPYVPASLRHTKAYASGLDATDWYGDGTHYVRPAKRAVAEQVAAWSGWDLPRPTPYQKISAATFTGWGAPTGTRTRTAFDPSTVTLSQLGERVAGLVDDLAALIAQQR